MDPGSPGKRQLTIFGWIWIFDQRLRFSPLRRCSPSKSTAIEWKQIPDAVSLEFRDHRVQDFDVT